MQPPSVKALDILPYNTFTLRCVASAPANILLQKSFVWRNGSNIVTDNGNNVLITNHNVAMPVSTSELTVNEPSIGSYTYYCTVSMSVPGGLDLSTFTTGRAIVAGKYYTAVLLSLYFNTYWNTFTYRSKCSHTTYFCANCEHYFKFCNCTVDYIQPLLHP